MGRITLGKINRDDPAIPSDLCGYSQFLIFAGF